MLELDKILWVIPGLIVIFIRNKKRSTKLIKLSGWNLVLVLVILSAVTWLPAQLIVEKFEKETGEDAKVEQIFKNKDGVEKGKNPERHSLLHRVKLGYGDFKTFLAPKYRILVYSILISILTGLLLRMHFISKFFFEEIYDNFHIKCLGWEEELIILTLRSDKSYIGLLWKYPENPMVRHESQTISIVPYLSGYRHKETKKNNLEYRIPCI